MADAASVTPSPTPTSTVAAVLPLHHYLLTAVLAFTLIGGSVALYNHLIEAHDARVAAEQLQKEGVDTSAQAALVAQLQKQQAADEVRDQQALATIQNLVQQMQTSRAQTAKQVAADATLDAQSAAARLVAQEKAAATDATANGDLVTMTLPLTRKVVADLDELPQAQADVNNLQGQLGAQQTLTTDAKEELNTANQTIAADKTELIATIKADDASCKVQLDQQAAKARKRTIWLTILGVLGGAALRGAL